jgi:hypothetical protein
VTWSHALKRDKANESKKPGSFDVLLDGVRDPAQFSDVLSRWLERQEAWHGARWCFFRLFEKQRHYDPDRLIGGANMFDILAASGVPDNVLLSPEIMQAPRQSHAMFKMLPQSPERDSILSALGRLGKACSQTQGTLSRTKACGIGSEWFPDLYTVTDEAVNCRNYYVHGTTYSFNYDRNLDLVTFFTNTLEFVFATSESNGSRLGFPGLGHAGYDNVPPVRELPCDSDWGGFERPSQKRRHWLSRSPATEPSPGFARGL